MDFGITMNLDIIFSLRDAVPVESGLTASLVLKITEERKPKDGTGAWIAYQSANRSIKFRFRCTKAPSCPNVYTERMIFGNSKHHDYWPVICQYSTESIFAHSDSGASTHEPTVSDKDSAG